MKVSLDAIDGLLRAPVKKVQVTTLERAAANRLTVLRAVAEHGHLRCADLATACWPRARHGEQMAQRTVRVPVGADELKARRHALGGAAFVLTRPGADALELRHPDPS